MANTEKKSYTVFMVRGVGSDRISFVVEARDFKQASAKARKRYRNHRVVSIHLRN